MRALQIMLLAEAAAFAICTLLFFALVVAAFAKIGLGIFRRTEIQRALGPEGALDGIYRNARRLGRIQTIIWWSLPATFLLGLLVEVLHRCF